MTTLRPHPHGSHAAARDHCLGPADLLTLGIYRDRPTRPATPA